jgi:hypothetical protein
MQSNAIALMIYGVPGSTRNALTEEKYRKLAAHFIEKRFAVDSVLYHDSISDKLEKELLKYAAILVWVNPVEQGSDRKILDTLLMKLSDQGRFLSSNTQKILKIWKKEILKKVRGKEFCCYKKI